MQSLSLGWLATKPGDLLYLLAADWFSDARADYFGIVALDPKPLRIIHHAVPSLLRREIRDELINGWLHTMVEWVQRASAQGNAWTASDHHWHLIRAGDGQISVDER